MCWIRVILPQKVAQSGMVLWAHRGFTSAGWGSPASVWAELQRRESSRKVSLPLCWDR